MSLASDGAARCQAFRLASRWRCGSPCNAAPRHVLCDACRASVDCKVLRQGDPTPPLPLSPMLSGKMIVACKSTTASNISRGLSSSCRPHLLYSARFLFHLLCSCVGHRPRVIVMLAIVFNDIVVSSALSSCAMQTPRRHVTLTLTQTLTLNVPPADCMSHCCR